MRTLFQERLVNEALYDAHARRDPHWTLRSTSAAVLDAMDEMLVRDGHPLAMQPGTQEQRFCALAWDGHRFRLTGQ